MKSNKVIFLKKVKTKQLLLKNAIFAFIKNSR